MATGPEAITTIIATPFRPTPTTRPPSACPARLPTTASGHPRRAGASARGTFKFRSVLIFCFLSLVSFFNDSNRKKQLQSNGDRFYQTEVGKKVKNINTETG